MDIKVKNCNKIKIFLPMCWENTILSYSFTIDEKFDCTFANYWTFHYSSEYKTISEGCELYDKLYYYLEKYCGYELKIYQTEDINQLLNVISENLKNNLPTIIHGDTFYLRWNGYYNILHSEHLVLVKQIIKDGIIVVDSDYPNDEYELSIQELENMCQYYFRFFKVDDICINEGILLEELINSDKLIDSDMFLNIEKFSDDFRTKFNYKNEFAHPYGPNEVLDSQLIMGIRYAIKGRFLFVNFLTNASNQLGIDLNSVVDLIEVSTSKWNNIISLIFKQSCMGWKIDIIQKIYTILLDIKTIETSAYQLLNNIVKRKSIVLYESQKLESVAVSCFEFDMSEYFNNKGLSIERDMYLADLTGLGEYIVVNDCYSEKIYCENVKFHIALGMEKDNITCMNQTLRLKESVYCKGIGVLCCTEWGKNKEMIMLENTDGERIPIYFKASDIAEVNESNVINIGKSLLKDGFLIREKNVLTYNIVFFNEYQKICRITLPNSQNIHIFSITFII